MYGTQQVSGVLDWIPGVSVSVLEYVVAIPHKLALLCVTPLRIFSFFCVTGIYNTHNVMYVCDNIIKGLG